MKQLVSLKLLRRQKNFLRFLIVFFIALGIITVGNAIESANYFSLFSLPLFLVLPFMFYRDLKRVKSIAYDQSSLYYRSGDREPEKSIPLENIRTITIGNFTANFRLYLYTPDEDGQQIYFKFPDMWNPFATKKRVAEIYALRDTIDACKRRADDDFEGKTKIVRLAEV